MKSKSDLLIAVLTFVGCFVMLALRPVPAASIHNTNSITGKVIEISKGSGHGDLLIHLANDDRTFYINRGIENGLSLEKLKSHLQNQQTTLTFVKHWTPLNPSRKLVPLAKISLTGCTYWQQSAP